MSRSHRDPDSLPPGWAYNPSEWKERIPIIVLGFIAMLIAGHLAGYQLGWWENAWDPVFGDGTETVLDSDLSHLFPVPDALLGAAGYAIDWIFGAVGGTRRYKTMPWAVIVLGIGVVPFGLTSIFLGLAMPVMVGAWCFLCLLNTLIAIILIPYAWDEVWLSLVAMRNMMRNGASFWSAFTGRAADLAF